MKNHTQIKRTVNVCVLLGFILLSSCSDNSIPETIPPEEPVTPIEPTPEPEEDNHTLPLLSVVGRYLRNAKGEIVNLHGFTQTYSPFFNNNAWSNYDVQACLSYNKRMVDEILAAGWKFNFVRLHLDPYWSDDTSLPYVRYEGHERFSDTRFRKYLDELFVPMAEYFISKGMYVVMRPPGVSPNQEPADRYQGIEVGDTYQQFLLKVWDIVSQHAKLKNNSGIMFELANEPVNIKGTAGTYGSMGDACFANMKTYFQAIVDKIRNHCNNIIWVPGLAYQSSYAGYATHRMVGENIGFAVHCYPGWYGSDAEQDSGEGIGSSTGGGYEAFQRGWDAQVGPVADFAPIMVTEIDWAPKKYDATWGKSVTGTAGGKGFGANFKYIADNSGNVSWLFFTTNSHELAAFKNVPGEPGNYTFLNDPEACPWPIYHWFKEYAEASTSGTAKQLVSIAFDGIGSSVTMLTGSNKYLLLRAYYVDGTSELITGKATYSSSSPETVRVGSGRMTTLKDGGAIIAASFNDEQVSVSIESTTFPLTNDLFDANIWEKGSFDENTKTLITGSYGFGGWHYNNGINLSGYKYVIAELDNDNECAVSFRLFDENNYWSTPASYDFGNTRRVVVTLDNMYKTGSGQVKVSPLHIYYVGFWSLGHKPINIKRVYLTNTNA